MNILFEMLEEKLTPSEVVELLSSFEKDDLCDYAERNLICTRCYSDLIIHKWKESRGRDGKQIGL